jgi:microcystin degradation protein MlrC
MRIAVAGLHTECSTWNPVLMQTADFRVLRGAALLDHSEFHPLRDFAVDWVPLLHARALPGGPIARATYAAFKTEFLDGLARCLPIEGLYLAMHGACFVEGISDAEGDWITAARAVVGPDCLISASYDLHGNVSGRIIDALDMFSAYRTAPHIDVDATKRRACTLLVDAIGSGQRPFLAWAPVPVLLPGERTSTEDEPARTLYALLPALEARRGVLDAALMVGYVWADEPRATACAVVTATEEAAARQAAADLAQAYWQARAHFRFGPTTGSIAECLDLAVASATAPVILADSGDNPTGGGVGDRADLLAELLARDITDVIVAGIVDAPAADFCYQAGVGSRVGLHVGGTLDPSGASVQVSGNVMFLADAHEAAERRAVIHVDGIALVLTARRRPFHSLTDFTTLGLDPRAARLVVVKSGYLSPELAPIANPNLLALSPGVVNQDIPSIPIRHVPRPVFPWDQDFDWTPVVVVSARRAG